MKQIASFFEIIPKYNEYITKQDKITCRQVSSFLILDALNFSQLNPTLWRVESIP